MTHAEKRACAWGCSLFARTRPIFHDVYLLVYSSFLMRDIKKTSLSHTHTYTNSLSFFDCVDIWRDRVYGYVRAYFFTFDVSIYFSGDLCWNFFLLLFCFVLFLVRWIDARRRSSVNKNYWPYMVKANDWPYMVKSTWSRSRKTAWNWHISGDCL